ncbi:hypothetical protein [Mucilaginibacter aquaedulcis]|uniref:hypothetical protein n=1 Tax=Mucilaginibacter aquaedulcis TaxID=1187081 RepID=UPI0025B475F3|nr:hypothetical protein [Mucilaginibacter aquaedulcis]MDN3548969.1 hypothetical protein [Mucilaginibacter aquaedulcis]
MNQQKQPVIYEIEGTHFEVDIDRQVLRQTNDQSNEISFIGDMQDQGAFYTLRYDPDKKHAADELSAEQRVKTVHVPQMTDLDREGMALKYGLPRELVMGKSDFELIVDQQLLDQRLNGALPQIDLAGELFTVDLRLRELPNSRHFFPVISLKSFELTGDGTHYEAYYHPVMKQVVELDPKLLEFPEGVIKLRLPNELGLDPVATARAHGIDQRELLRRYPIQKNLKAEVIPLSETHVPALIRRNKEALREEHRENARRLRPGKRPKF